MAEQGTTHEMKPMPVMWKSEESHREQNMIRTALHQSLIQKMNQVAAEADVLRDQRIVLTARVRTDVPAGETVMLEKQTKSELRGCSVKSFVSSAERIVN